MSNKIASYHEKRQLDDNVLFFRISDREKFLYVVFKDERKRYTVRSTIGSMANDYKHFIIFNRSYLINPEFIDEIVTNRQKPYITMKHDQFKTKIFGSHALVNEIAMKSRYFKKKK